MYGIDIDGTDRALEHSITYALIEIGDDDAIATIRDFAAFGTTATSCHDCT